MGWLELNSWLEAVQRQREGPERDPDKWSSAEGDPWWEQMRAQRDRERAGTPG